ncbi:HNH endonuclease [Streptomyces sp. NPDC001142]
MIKNLMRGLAALSLTLASLAATTPAAQARAAEPTVLPIGAAVSALPLGTESRSGYTRTAFRHWNSGANPSDGCNTRAEVLIAEAVTPPAIGPRYTLTGGTWWSYYDEQTVTSASGLDIDHMVPLAEAWDSGPPPGPRPAVRPTPTTSDVALYATASVDAVPAAHPEIDWAQLRAVEKGRRSPLATLRTAPATAPA